MAHLYEVEEFFSEMHNKRSYNINSKIRTHCNKKVNKNEMKGYIK